MNDSKISKKPLSCSSRSTKAVQGSLARRVLTVSLCLLVIPLFFHSIFLFWQEYKQKLSDVEQMLEILGKERVERIEQLIEFEWDLIDAKGNAEKLKVEKIPLPTGVSGRFAMVSQRRDALLVGVQQSPTIAHAIANPFNSLIEKISQEEDSPYPIRLALTGKDGKLLAENMPVRAKMGLLQVYFPIPNTSVRLELTIPRDLIRDLQQKQYYYRFATLLFFLVVIGGGLVWWLTSRIGKPLMGLCKTMSRVSEGAIHARYVPDRMGFEINELGKQFNETLDALVVYSQEAQKERIARERLAEELRIGHEIQASLLPADLPDYPGLDIATGYFPATEVSGDFYELFQMENGSLLIAMTDTAGKGISACLYALGLRSMIRSHAAGASDLSEIVLRANDLFWLDVKNSGMFVTAWIGIYDPATRKLTYCSQGHPPALLKRGGKMQKLWTKGIALGAQKLDVVSTEEITLKEGDLLFLYTDGITEAHGPGDELFGQKRLEELLHHEGKGSSRDFIQHLTREVSRFSQNVPQHDDIAMLALRVHK